jgi:hypothetical protein
VIQDRDVVIREFWHLGKSLFNYGMPLPVRDLCRQKLMGRPLTSPLRFTSWSLQRGIHENVFANPNPHPGREIQFKIKGGYSDAPVMFFHNIPHHVTMVKQFMNVVIKCKWGRHENRLTSFPFHIPLKR